MGHELFEETRVAAWDEPLAPGERRLQARDYDAALAHLRMFEGIPEVLEALRRLVAKDVCAAVHQLSDAGLLRAVAARIDGGELELRARDLRVPEAFPRWTTE